jgi:hypothetical protein
LLQKLNGSSISQCLVLHEGGAGSRVARSCTHAKLSCLLQKLRRCQVVLAVAATQTVHSSKGLLRLHTCQVIVCLDLYCSRQLLLLLLPRLHFN